MHCMNLMCLYLISSDFPMHMKKYQELDRNCREVIAEVSAIPKAFATFEVIFQILLFRYGIDSNFQTQLDVYQIPSLNLLKDILAKVNMFIRTYLSTNAIITIVSLEEDMMDFLKGFNFPTLKVREMKYFDPHELCVDDDLESHPQSLIHFSDYGLGDLLNHPQLKYYFDSSIRPTSTVSSKDVVTYLLGFLQDRNLTAPLKEHNIATVAASFPGYLYKRLANIGEDDEDDSQSLPSSQVVEQLRRRGILLQANLSDEVLCLQHVLNSHHNLMVDITKRELLMHRQISFSMGEGESKRVKRKRQNIDLEDEDEKGGSEGDDTKMAPTILDPSSPSLPLKSDTVPARAYPEALLLSSLFEGRVFNHHEVNPSHSNRTDIEFVGPEVLRPLLPYLQHDLATAKVGDKESDLKAVGRWGELLVYQFLLSRCPHPQQQPLSSESAERFVQWVNKDGESKACYDFIVHEDKDKDSQQLRSAVGRTTFVEVKTSRFPDLNVFELSLWEWEFANALPRVNYHIYRVFNASDPANCRITILRDVPRLVQERRIKLCLAV